MFAFIRMLAKISARSIRRYYLNRSYSKNPKVVAAETLRKFEIFLTAGQSPLTRKYFGPGQCLGPITVSGYMRMLKKMIKDMGLLVPDEDQIREYSVSLKEKNKSYSHRLNYRNLLLHWGYFNGYSVDLPRERKPLRVLKNIPSIEDVQKLIAVAKTDRERAIILTLIRTGLRVSELSGLKPADIDFPRKKIVVIQGKNSKDRIVNVTDDCLEALRIYLAKRKNKSTEPIFSKPQIIRRTLKRMAKRTDIDVRVHPHAFRHAFATHAIYSGLDLITIQHQLGHSSALTTSKVYINLTEDQQKKKYEQFAPSYEIQTSSSSKNEVLAAS